MDQEFNVRNETIKIRENGGEYLYNLELRKVFSKYETNQRP